jgi:hypothetical protein
MPTREQVRSMVGQDGNFAGAARRWGIPPGRAYLIATGRAADAAGGVDGRAQALVNPREVNPTGRDDVRAWVKRRAYADASMRSQG